MKGSLLWKLMYLFCALTGCLAGYGIFYLANGQDIKPNTITKDNTLVRESGDGVFFDGINEYYVLPAVPVVPTEPAEPESPAGLGQAPVTAAPLEPGTGRIEPDMAEPGAAGTEPDMADPGAAGTEPGVLPTVTVVPENQDTAKETSGDILPPLSSQWEDAVPTVFPTPAATLTPSTAQNEAEETITYPYEIFGQVPVVNRSDATVTYFEFAIDLINAMEPEIQQRGLNMNTLLMKFVVKALFCGVDVEDLNINAPIPRRQAALCLWLAAQLLDEPGTGTSSKTAQAYVTDLGGCSGSEKKAVAYLYEQGFIAGYQVTGQRFYPDSSLGTEAGNTWISRAKQCWN